MPRRCCVPGCQSNYGKKQEVSTFVLKWLRSIHRENFEPSASSVVCCLHFREEDIIREDVIKRADGSEIREPRKIPKLTVDAVPCNFPGQPSYMSTQLPKKREGVEKRQEDLKIRDKELLDNFMKNDRITDYNDFKENFATKLTPEWTTLIKDDYVLIMRITIDYENRPQIDLSIHVSKDLRVSIVYNNVPLHPKKFQWLLGKNDICDRWSMFDSLISHLNTYDYQLSSEDRIAHILKSLEKLFDERSANCGESEFNFLLEQVKLKFQKRNRFSPELIIFASILYYHNPSAYRFLRGTGHVALPHPK